MRASSVVVGGAETERLAALCKELVLSLVIGVNERVEVGPGNGTLYNALLIFDASGTLQVHRRKLVPTHTERLVWGRGDGRDLTSVATGAGRVGAMICWEHWMPLARQAMHEAGEQVHVALWPWGNEAHQLASRHYAFEGRCIVLSVGLIMPTSDVPAGLKIPDDAGELLLRGGSAVIGPRGEYVIEPVLDREELIIAEIDLESVDRERMTLDVAGHYARPDVFSFSVSSDRPGEDS